LPKLLMKCLDCFDMKQISDFFLIFFKLSTYLRNMSTFINHNLTFTISRDLLQIQGDSRGNLSILRSDSIGRCEKRKFV
jgi:hypothetical protein